MLALALSVDPDPAGFGTHEQLGLSPCGYYARTGQPCPTCGMTTSFAHFARFEVVDAFRAQPLGALLWAITAGLTLASLFHLLAWRSPERWIRALPRPLVLIGIGIVLLLASWWFKLATFVDEPDATARSVVEALEDPQVAVVADGTDLLRFDRFLHGTARLVAVRAVGKAASTRELGDLGEEAVQAGTVDFPQAELANTRRVDHVAAEVQA